MPLKCRMSAFYHSSLHCPSDCIAVRTGSIENKSFCPSSDSCYSRSEKSQLLHCVWPGPKYDKSHSTRVTSSLGDIHMGGQGGGKLWQLNCGFTTPLASHQKKNMQHVKVGTHTAACFNVHCNALCIKGHHTLQSTLTHILAHVLRVLLFSMETRHQGRTHWW